MDIKFLKKIIFIFKLKKLIIFLINLYSYFFRFHTVKRGEIKYSLDLYEAIDRAIFFGGWEPLSIDWIKKNVNIGDVVIEVGANVGAHSLLIAKNVYPDGQVYLFEPTDYAYCKLSKNLNLNPNLKKITKVHKTLVSNESNNFKDVTIRSSWIYNKTVETEKKMDEVLSGKTESLDNLFRNIKRLNLIKIDVDGFDYKVLQGAEYLIKKFKPKIFIELNDYQLRINGDSIENILNFLKKNGYIGILEDNTKVKSYNQVMEVISKIPAKYTNAYFE